MSPNLCINVCTTAGMCIKPLDAVKINMKKTNWKVQRTQMPEHFGPSCVQMLVMSRCLTFT